MTATKNEINFDTLEELRDQAIKDEACPEGLEWLNKQESLEEVFESISLINRRWCLHRGYVQFAEKCDWKKLTGYNWSALLIKQPQFSEFCDWDKLNGKNWSWLLSEQPQFAKHCNWKKLDGHNWSFLLVEQSQFAKFCNWQKLNAFNWSDLLHEQPQFEKYKLQKIY